METLENVPQIQVEHEKQQDTGRRRHSSSENGTDSDNEKSVMLKLVPRVQQERRDSGSSVGEEEEEIGEITDELREKIITQAEYYFSDENLKRDGFLLKHVKRNKEGYVNLKLLASFKKMRSLSRDHRVIGEALKGATKLVVNETGLKLRRVDPLPKELLEQVRVKHIVVSKISGENPSMNYITDAFPKHREDIVSVRIVKPGKKFPNDLQSHFSRHTELRDETVAVVEFDSPEVASAAVKTDFHETYKGLYATLLHLGPKQGKKKENGETASDTPVDSDASTDTHKQRQKKKKAGGRLLEVTGMDDSYSSYASSSDGEFSSFSSCGKRYNRSHGSSPAASPNMARRQINDRNNNSRNASPMSSPGGSPRFPRKLRNHTPERSSAQNDHSPVRNGHKLSPLLASNSPRSSPEAKRKNLKGNNDNGAGQSAWMLKRMQLNSKENINTETLKAGHKQLDIVRQPRGPDGSSGFSSHPLKKFVLIHAC